MSNINAVPLNSTEIKVSWKLPSPNQEMPTSLRVFRAEKPFITSANVQAEKPLAVLDSWSTFFIDSVPSSKEYYYSVLVVSNSGIHDVILPSINCTVIGCSAKKTQPEPNEDVSLPETAYPPGILREAPMPTLDVTRAKQAVKQNMSQEAYSVAKEFGKQKSLQKLQPYAFEEDLMSSSGGDDYLLFDMLHNTFAKKRYKPAIEKLTDFLGVNRNKQITDRATFYLGECYYFAGDYHEAVHAFLQVKETYPVLVGQWIDSSLDLIDIPD